MAKWLYLAIFGELFLVGVLEVYVVGTMVLDLVRDWRKGRRHE